MRRTPAWVAAAAVLSLSIATGCNSTSSPSANRSLTTAPSNTSATSSSSNASDVAFTTALDQLDGQVHRLAALVPDRTAHHDLTTLAADIAQHRLDLATMPAWPTYGQQAGATPRPKTSGLLPAATLRVLSAMHGDAFDDAWLEHTAGTYAAIAALCQQELSHGVNPQARSVATQALATQPGLLSRVRQYHDSWMHDGRLGSPMTPVPRSSPQPHHSETPHNSPQPHHSETPHATSSRHR